MRGERQECRESWSWLPPGTNSHLVLKSNYEVSKERVSVMILPFQTDSGRGGLARKAKRHKMVAQFSSIAQSGPTLCDPNGLQSARPPCPSPTPDSGSLLRLVSIDSVMPSNHLILCRPLLLPPSVYPSIRVFSNESALCINGQSIGVSASTSVLPMNIQDRSPLGWTGWISLQSKGL